MKLSIVILISLISTYCFSHTITFDPIKNYAHENESTSFIDYELCIALNNQANDLFFKKNYSEASIVYKQAIASNPVCADIYFNLGQALYYEKKYSEALEAYKKAITYKPDHSLAYMQIAQLMLDFQQQKTAVMLLKKVLTLEPNNPNAYLKLARIYINKVCFEKAIIILTDGLAHNPNNVNLLFELGNTYNLINEFDKSLTLYTYLNEQVPDNVSILHNIAITLRKMERIGEALFFYDKTLKIDPNNKQAQCCRGIAYLSIGDFEKGLADYEYRHIPPIPQALQTSNKPVWDGSNLDGKTILIHNAEQSLGDTLQFIRYAQLIKEKNGIVIAAVQTALIPIIKLCPYIDHVVSKDETSPPFDVHASIMSLPYILQTRLDTIPNKHPYLHANENLVNLWQQQLTKDKNFKIGICWQGNNDPSTTLLFRTIIGQKSINIAEFAPINDIPGISLYSLQKVTGTDQLNHLSDTFKIITFDGDFDENNGRFMDTAAMMKNLDLIITVDTSIGHLAAGLGVETWVILPNPADWRWMINRNDSPWYPTMRLFKQPKPGDWQTIIKEVAVELQKHISRK